MDNPIIAKMPSKSTLRLTAAAALLALATPAPTPASAALLTPGHISGARSFSLYADDELRFANLTYAGHGGAVTHSIATTTASTFVVNEVGGGIVNFLNNTARLDGGAYGGAIFNSGPAAATPYAKVAIRTQAVFSGNIATAITAGDAFGGAIHNANGLLEITPRAAPVGTVGTILFENNRAIGKSTTTGPTATATAAGGAIYNSGLDSEVTLAAGDAGTIVFRGNSAEAPSAQGGAIYNLGADSFSAGAGVFFEDNHALATGNALGGAIYNIGGNGDLDSPVAFTFTANYARSTGATGIAAGGAIHVSAATANVNLADSLFIGNFADGFLAYGGALSVFVPDNHTGAVNVNLAGSVFQNNHADATYAYGGALAFLGANLTVNLRDALFIGNRATSSTPAANTGGGAIATAARSTTTLTDTDFLDNATNATGGAILLGTSAALNIAVSANLTTTYSGNTAAAAPNSIHLAGANTINIHTAAAATLDMRDPISATANAAVSNITKTGPGLWLLAGANALAIGNAAANLTLSAGTLQLQRAGATTNPGTTTGLVEHGHLDLGNGTLTTAATAILAVGGSGHHVKAANIRFDAGATLGFDFAAHASDPAAPQLLLDGTVSTAGPLNVDLLTVRDLDTIRNGQYSLALAATAQFTGLVNPLVKIADTDYAATDASARGLIISAHGGATGPNANPGEIYLVVNNALQNYEIVWTNFAGSNEWNLTQENWKFPQDPGHIGSSKFFPGDHVVFTGNEQSNGNNTQDGANASGTSVSPTFPPDANEPSTIHIVPTTAEVGGMTVTGGNYVFTGGAIGNTGVTATSTGNYLQTAGRVTFANTTNTFTTANLNGGELWLSNSTLAAPTFAMSPAAAAPATFGGIGTVHGNVILNGGRFRPGWTPATAAQPPRLGALYVAGDVTLAPGAEFVATLAGTAPADIALLETAGLLTLAGGNRLSLDLQFSPAPGDQFLIARAADVVGSFANENSVVEAIFDDQKYLFKITYPTALAAADSSAPDLPSNGLPDTADALALEAAMRDAAARDAIILTVARTTTFPEPTTYSLCAGLAALCLALTLRPKRHRRH